MSPAVLTATFLLIITLCYGVRCWLSPFGDCRRCKGIGRKVKVTRRGKVKPGNVCRRCHGNGIRVRVGRRLHTRLARAHRTAAQHATNRPKSAA